MELRLLKLIVYFHLVAGGEAVGFIGYAYHSHEFMEHFVGHAFVAGGHGVRGDAVWTLIRDAHSDVDQFLAQRIESAGSHDLFQGLPRALESGGIVGQSFPEIVDEIRLARRANIIVHGANFERRVRIFNHALGAHGVSSEVSPDVWLLAVRESGGPGFNTGA